MAPQLHTVLLTCTAALTKAPLIAPDKAEEIVPGFFGRWTGAGLGAEVLGGPSAWRSALTGFTASTCCCLAELGPVIELNYRQRSSAMYILCTDNVMAEALLLGLCQGEEGGLSMVQE